MKRQTTGMIVFHLILCMASYAVLFLNPLKAAATTSNVRKNTTHLAKQAYQYYQAGQYVEAIKILENAILIEPKAEYYFNIARCYEKLQKHREALLNYQKALEMFPDTKKRPVIEEFMAELRKTLSVVASEVEIDVVPKGATLYINDVLKPLPFKDWLNFGTYSARIEMNDYEMLETQFIVEREKPLKLTYTLRYIDYGWVDILSDIDKAQVFIDGNFVALSPVTGFKLAEGKHRITVEKDGYFSREEVIEIKRLQKEQFIIPLKAIPIERFVKVEKKIPGPFRIWKWALLGIGVASTGLGIVSHLMVVKKVKDANGLDPGVFPTKKAYWDAQDQKTQGLKAWKVLTFAGYGLGGASLATAIIFLILDGPRTVVTEERVIENAFRFEPGFGPNGVFLNGSLSF